MTFQAHDLVDLKDGSPVPVVQQVSAEVALATMKEGFCSSIMWDSNADKIAHRERMHPGSRTLYVACKHPEQSQMPEGHTLSESLAPVKGSLSAEALAKTLIDGAGNVR